MRRLVAIILALLAFAQPCAALSPAQEILLFGGVGGAALFASTTTGSIPPWLAYASAGVRYYFSASGSLWTSPNNQVRNSLMLGGPPPTYWSFNSLGGVTVTAGATFQANGMTWLPVTIAGTATATIAGENDVQFESSNTQIPGVKGQNFILSTMMYATGTLPTVAVDISGRTATGSGSEDGHSAYYTITGTPTQYLNAYTLTTATTAFVNPRLYFSLVLNQTYSGMLYIAQPQLELVTAAQTTPNPFMPTSGSAYFGPVANDHNPFTLAALGLRSEPQRTNLYLNSTAPATQTVTVVDGTTYTISFYGTGSVVVSGACATTMTGAAGVRTSYTCTAATVTTLVLTETGLTSTAYPQVEANAFATSPILAYGAAVTVPADNWSFTGAALAQLISGRACIAVQALAEPGEGAQSGRIFAVDDGTLSNRFAVTNNAANQVRFFGTGSNGFALNSYVGGGDMTVAPRTSVLSWGAALPQGAFDGSLMTGQTVSGRPNGMTEATIGRDNLGNPAFYGWYEQFMLRPSCTTAQVRRYSAAGANLQGN